MKKPELCEQCHKTPELCICQEIQPQKTRLHVLILQHPQEPDHEIGSARLTHLSLPNSTLKIGLSWRNLAAVLNKKEVDPTRWAVLYLGSGINGEVARRQPVTFVSRKGLPLEETPGIDGFVILDGTWSQAKTLWWRNAWLLKLQRIILTPQHKSLYKNLRKEPRRECLSTIEAVAEVLSALGEPAPVSQHLRSLFSQLLEKKRNNKS
jgi:DTW domain-containing protein